MAASFIPNPSPMISSQPRWHVTYTERASMSLFCCILHSESFITTTAMPVFCAGSRLWYGRSRCNDGGSTREPIPYTRPINPAPITCPRYMHSINWADWASQTVFWTKMITITFLSSEGKAIPWTNYFLGKRGVGMGSTWFCITTTVSSLLSAPTMHLNGITNFILQG